MISLYKVMFGVFGVFKSLDFFFSTGETTADIILISAGILNPLIASYGYFLLYYSQSPNLGIKARLIIDRLS